MITDVERKRKFLCVDPHDMPVAAVADPEIMSKNLRGAAANTKEGREGMALGQYIAGMGFSNVGLGIAHSMAHTLGAVYDSPLASRAP